MKTLVVGTCSADHTFILQDPDAPYETEFEGAVMRALACIYPSYRVFRFTGSFEYEGYVSKPDVALVARNLSHWFIIEVELASHSFDGHVLPQVRAFRYGEPRNDCSTILQRELNVSSGVVESLLTLVPRTVAVISNKPDGEWERVLRSHSIQFCSLSVFRSPDGTEAVELDGSLQPPLVNLGFGMYSAVDRSIKLTAKVPLPEGAVQIFDPNGSVGAWSVTRDETSAWVTKEHGTPSIPDGANVQILRTSEGVITLRVPEPRPRGSGAG